MKKQLLILSLVCIPLILNGCGAGNASTTPPPPVATQLAATVSSTTATAGALFQFTVSALDASGAVVPSYSGTVHITSSDPKAVLPNDSTLVKGLGTFHVTFETAGSQTITATDSATASIKGTSKSISVSAGAATHFSVSAPATASVGTALSFTVTALDASNNTAGSYSGTIHFSSTDGHATLPGNSTLTNGTATFPATLETGGSQTITATDTVATSIMGTSHTINVSGPVTHFSVSAPPNATAGTTFSFSVTALDASNNTAIGYSGTAHFTSTDGQAALPANSMLANGLGIFPATLKTVGSQTITGTDSVSASITGTSGSIQVTASRFKPAGSMDTPRYLHTATLLGDGKVLIAGGNNGIATLATAELFDPTSVSFSTTGNLTIPRDSHTATLLSDGSVLIAGGQDGNGNVLFTAELFDPTTGSFTQTDSMRTSRKNHTATLLSNGKVLIAGGFNGVAELTTAELFDPSSRTFTPTGSMGTARAKHTATRLTNGKVLVAGGFGTGGSTAELFDLSTGIFTPTDSMTASLSSHTATLLDDGKVLLVGGTTADLFDPSSGTFTATGSLTLAGSSHTATLLSDGTVLLTGGESFFFGGVPFCFGPHPQSTATAELYDSPSGTFTATSNMATERAFHTATMLTNSEVLVTGGIRWTYVLQSDLCSKQSTFVTSSAELFQ